MIDPIVEETTPEAEIVEDDVADESTVDERTLSQADVDKIVQKRLKRQEDALLKKFSDYEQRVQESESFRKLQDEKSTDSQRWEKEREKLMESLKERDSELTKLQRANLIADLASEKGLPKSFWKRVQGENEEQLAEDMDSIIKDLGLDVTPGEGKTTPKTAVRKSAVYGGGGVSEDPEPDTDAIVARIPRGPQLRVEKPRSYK